MSGHRKWADIVHKTRTEACKNEKHDCCGQYTFPEGQWGDPKPCQCWCHEGWPPPTTPNRHQTDHTVEKLT